MFLHRVLPYILRFEWGVMVKRCSFVVLFSLLTGCELGASERPADFSISVGVETVTVLDAEPNAPLTLYDADGTKLVTIIADTNGQAHFAYIPPDYQVLDPSNFEGITLADGTVLRPEDGYWIQDDSSPNLNWSGTFDVLSINDIPPKRFIRCNI